MTLLQAVNIVMELRNKLDHRPSTKDDRQCPYCKACFDTWLSLGLHLEITHTVEVQ